MKRRIVLLFTLSLMLSCLLTGCGKKKLDPFDPKIFNVEVGEEGVYIVYDYKIQKIDREYYDKFSREKKVDDTLETFYDYCVTDFVNNIAGTDPRSYIYYEIQFPHGENKLFNNDELKVTASLPVELANEYELKSASTTITVPNNGLPYIIYSYDTNEAEGFKDEMLQMAKDYIENAPSNYSYAANSVQLVSFESIKNNLNYDKASFYWSKGQTGANIYIPFISSLDSLGYEELDYLNYLNIDFFLIKDSDGVIRPFISYSLLTNEVYKYSNPIKF